MIDEAQELVPKAGSGIAEAGAPAENTIYVTTDPGAIAIRILATVEVIAARGPSARASLEAFAAAVATARPAGALRSPGEHEALVWFHRTGMAPTLVALPPRITEKRPIGTDVGRLLRRA